MNTPLDRNWNYFNVLEALVGALPKGDYWADVGKWTNAIAELRDKYEQDYPMLFSDIHFVRRAGCRAYSRQVSDFLVSQAFGGIKKVMNPTHDRIKLDRTTKDELVSRNQGYLAGYQEIINEMAFELESTLGIPMSASAET